jgi:hypothetical protein
MMQAGLTTRPLTLSEIFPPATFLWASESQVGTIDSLGRCR